MVNKHVLHSSQVTNFLVVTEAIAATAHSGIRSIYCYSLMVRYKSWYPLVPYPDILPTWAFEQLEFLANSQPFGDGRVSLGFGFDMWFLPKERITQIWDKARSLGIKLFTTHYCKNRIFGKWRRQLDYVRSKTYRPRQACNLFLSFSGTTGCSSPISSLVMEPRLLRLTPRSFRMPTSTLRQRQKLRGTLLSDNLSHLGVTFE